MRPLKVNVGDKKRKRAISDTTLHGSGGAVARHEARFAAIRFDFAGKGILFEFARS
jgi:hypothetical protein